MLFNLINGGDIRSTLISLLLSLPVILLSLSFHEFGHAWVANKCGDPTARNMGRVTLNPLKHLDPIGFLMMFMIGIGYAKPVPVNPRNFKNPRRDDLLVSLAGVTCNLILAFVGAVLMFLYIYMINFRPSAFLESQWMIMIYQMVLNLIIINLSLTVFNLLPVPPLDGYHVVNDLLFKRQLFAPQLASRIGTGLLLVLVVTGALDRILSFVIGGTMNGLVWLFVKIMGG